MSQQIIEGYQMSPQQKHLWSLFEAGEQMPYRAQCAILMKGALDKEILRTALQQIVERQEILRTSFDFLSDMTMPLQVINESGQFSFEETDLTDLSEAAQETLLKALLRDAAQRPGSFADGGQLHFNDVRLSPDKHVLLVSLPSLYADTAALKILMRELGDCYAACLRGEEPAAEPIQYADLSEWQNESLEAEGSEIGLDYWRKLEESATPVLSLPFEKVLPQETEFKPESGLSQRISPETIARLARQSAAQDSTLSSALLASFCLLLSRLTAAPQLSLGVSFDGRNYEELASALGLFARFLPINAELAPDLSVSALLSSLDGSLAEASRWQELFTSHAQSSAAPSFFPFCFEFIEEAEPSLDVTDSLSFTVLQSSAYVSRFKVLLRCLRHSDGSVVAEWHYDAAVYSEAEIFRLAERWATVVESISLKPGSQSVDEIEVVGATEMAELLKLGCGEDEQFAGDNCLHEIFAAQAARTPDAVAVVYEQESLTYRELNERANQLARYLQSKGVRGEARVGLMMERSIEMVVGMLGTLKAGGSYVPLEKSQPVERLRQMVEDAGVQVIISMEVLRAEAESLGAEVVVYIDSEMTEISKESAAEIQAIANAENVAYVIYTSGSTGSPKGVCVEHRQLVNYLNAILQKLNLPARASFALVSTFAADLGNTVIFPSLCSGGTLHVISQERISDAGALAEYFGKHVIDCLKIVPSHLSALMTHSQPELVLPRKCLVLGGEASGWELVERIQKLVPDCRILNHYGPTETTVGVLTYAVETESAKRDSKTVPLGSPIANTQVYILDALLRPVALGMPGELHIGGANVTRGYLNSSQTAAAKFIPDSFSRKPGARLYKTGDLARFLPDGSIEFLGRTDDQVKVRGFRTEPGEIEAVIRQHQGVAQVKVLARETLTGDKRLVAYLVPEEQSAATVLQWLRLEREGRLHRRQCYELPNRMLVASQNKNETDFMYKEIFEEKIYLQHGVSLRDGDCVFDVGANIGMFSLFVGQTCRNAKIYAFEPIPPLSDLLRANAALYGLDAKIFKCGVAADTARQEFTYYPHLTLMSGRFADLREDQEVVRLFESNRRQGEDATALDDQLLGEVLAERMTSESFTCQMKRISDVIREHRVERIDLLKIDVQKSELEVLGGIDEEDWAKFQQVVLEVHNIDDRLQQIVTLFETQGFQVAIRQETMLKETALFDVYCVRPERAQNLSSTSDALETSGRLPLWASPDSLLEDLRAYLKDSLPDYMIPSDFVLLENMPLTPNGKLDRQALPEPVEVVAGDSNTFVAPGTETEEILAGIWQQVLGLEHVGIHDNFFELGGDSILSIQIVARANQAGLKLSPKQLFRHQSIAELASAITISASTDAQPIAAEQGLLTGTVPLTPIQHYFFEQSLTEQQHFNQSLLLTVRRAISAEQLQQVVTALLEQHDGLRLRFIETEAGWQQSYGGKEAIHEVVVQQVDVSHLAEAEQRAEIEAVSAGVQQSMKLESGGLLRVVLFETGAEQRLLVVAHHLVVDGVSWRILIEDMARGLEQVEQGEAITFGSKTTSYRRWAERIGEYAQSEEAASERAYWAEVTQKWGGGQIPVDYPEGQNTIESARTISASLDTEETRVLLQEVPEAYRTQINDVLLTALVEAFGKWSGQRQALIDMEGHGREELWEDIDLSRTVGWFTTLFPVILELNANAQSGARLKSVKEQLRRVPQRGIGYGLLRYLSKDAEVSEEMRSLPQAEVRFNYLGQLDNVLPHNSLFGLSNEATGAERDRQQRRTYLLDVNGAVSGGRLQLNIIYSENVHGRAAIEAFSNSLLEALRAIIEHCQSLESSDFSPSDFPLANLSQQQLDLILSKTSRGGDSYEN